MNLPNYQISNHKIFGDIFFKNIQISKGFYSFWTILMIIRVTKINLVEIGQTILEKNGKWRRFVLEKNLKN